MSMTTHEAAGFMSMKPETIRSVTPVADGHLVTTSEGAQTLIAPDGRCSAVLPPREVLNVAGRGSVQRFAEEQAAPAAIPAPSPVLENSLPDRSEKLEVSAPVDLPAPAPTRRAPAKRAPARRPARKG